MDLISQLFNIVLMVFIVSTMLTAGFQTSISQLRSVLSRWWLVLGAFGVAFVVRPLLGWGGAELVGLSAAGVVAMALVWSCPGAPFGVKLVQAGRADIQSGAVLQVLLAAIGSITFAPTANAIIDAAGIGGEISLPVADLIVTVAALQLVPFVVGLAVRHYNRERALEWSGWSARVSGQLFLVVLVGALLGSWETVIDLLGSGVLIAAALVSVAIIAIGFLAASGERSTRDAAGLVQCCTNSGPSFAAVAIAFGNDPEILGFVTAILLVQIVVGLPAAAWLGRHRAEAAPEPA